MVTALTLPAHPPSLQASQLSSLCSTTPRWTTTAPAWQPAHQTGPSKSLMCAMEGRSLLPTSGGKCWQAQGRAPGMVWVLRPCFKRGSKAWEPRFRATPKCIWQRGRWDPSQPGCPQQTSPGMMLLRAQVDAGVSLSSATLYVPIRRPWANESVSVSEPSSVHSQNWASATSYPASACKALTQGPAHSKSLVQAATATFKSGKQYHFMQV